MNFIKPLSTPQGADHKGALPEPTYELVGDQGIYMAVGHPGLAIVYRGTWNKNAPEGDPKGSWKFSYMHEVKETCSCGHK